MAALGWLLVVVLVPAGGRAAWTGLHAAATTRSVVFHTHGCPLQVAVDHERGHRGMIEALGGSVELCWVQTTGDGRNATEGRTKGRVPRGTSWLECAAVSYAGGIAAGTWWGCESDREHASSEIASGYGFWQRDRAHAQARALAEKHVGRGLFGPTVHGHVEVR